MSRITWLPSVPWEPTATVLILTFCLTKALDRRVARRGGVAVADDDHVLHGGVGELREAGGGHLHAAVEGGHVADRHAVDAGEHHLPAGADADHAPLRLAPEPLVGAVPLDEAAVVAGAERFDRLDGDALLPVVRLRDFAGVHHQAEGADGDDLGAFDREVDRHRFFELRVGPTAGAVGVGAADHHEAAAELAGVADEHVDLFVAEAGDVVDVVDAAAGDVGEDDGVVALQLGERIEELVAADDGDFDLFAAEAIGEVVEVAAVFGVLDQQDLALAADVGEGRGDVVLRHASATGSAATKRAS